jgi:hypothetical protein
MHIGIHLAVKNQLKQKEPMEVCEFYNAIKEKNMPHHEIIHRVCSILVPFVFDTMKRFKSLLVKHSDTDTELLEAFIHKEFETDKTLIDQHQTINVLCFYFFPEGLDKKPVVSHRLKDVNPAGFH